MDVVVEVLSQLSLFSLSEGQVKVVRIIHANMCKGPQTSV